MKKFFLAMMCIIVFISCNNTDEMDMNMVENIETNNLPENLSKELNNFIASLPQDYSTRSTGQSSYTIRNVESIITKNISTRSKEILPDTIMHFVSFDDGYAVITHNLLNSNILAFVEQGNVNMNFFKNADPDKYLEKVDKTRSSCNAEDILEEDITNFTEDEFSDYLSEIMYMYALRAAESKKAAVTRIHEDSVHYVETDDDLNWWLTYPLIKTKWHQNSPFNTFASEALGKTVYAGCGNIAVAQLFTYHGLPNRLPNGYTFSQSSYASARSVHSYYNAIYSSGTSTEQKLVSEFIYNIGVCQYADWGSSGTSTYAINTAALLRSCGYNNVVLKDFEHSKIDYLVLEGEGCPTLMRGSRSTESGTSGHMWIVDGIAIVIPKKWFDIDTKIHCNFGWGGINDGWYDSNLFQRNTTNYLTMTEYGDVLSSMYAYSLNQKTISYDPF